MSKLHSPDSHADSEIAIIGMSCRFPGANDTDTFWQNLRDGVESIRFFENQELVASGVDPALVSNPNYVKASSIVPDIECFDASFFDFSAREAEMIDPQHRLFLECAWEAMERAGYDTHTYEGAIGVYAGTGTNTYLLNNLDSNLDVLETAVAFQLMIGNDKDFLPTRISYKLNLKGPSINVQTACSTSLVAIHLACQSLLNGECDMALAGGVSIRVPQKIGYLYQEGMILSPDGHCRAFDAKAQGTIAGNGLGIVVLKRLEDALEDGDCIHAVIKGSAINNDGSLKVGYTAPSVDGQAAAISEAQAVAGIEAETVSYIEAHGTGTPLGDPIEIAALTQAFSASTQKKNFCAIGSVKTNVGHLDTVAGVASLIKTVLALKHQMIPPSLHFEQPNPKIDFANSPFYVNSKLSEWKTDGTPRRAGVSSFGIGGTNAHVILEQAPPQETSGQSRPWQLLLISAKTNSALDTATANLVEHIKQHPDLNLADIAYTLSIGRKAFNHRRMLVCQGLNDAWATLSSPDTKRVFTQFHELGERPVAFMFTGQGSQYVNMARELYQVEPTFQEAVDACADILKPLLGLDLRHVLYPSEEQVNEASQQLQQTAITQPALFVIEYALAQLWMEWGVRPVAMLGHSIGEYVAATLAGVFSLEDALALVTARGQLMQQLPAGAMLAVPLPEQEVQPLLGKTLSLAAINGSSLCVVSGEADAINVLQHQLAAQGVECRLLHTSHAFHSAMMEPILEPFTELVKNISLQPPQRPYISNVTGTWITAAEATDPRYWARHLRQTVRFADGLQELLKEPAQILLEVGPGRTLSTLARRHPDKAPEQIVLSSLRHPQESQSDVAFLLQTLGQLWLAGVQVDWSGFYTHERRLRLPLPTYPFERQRYWIERQKPGGNDRATQVSSLTKKPDIADWFYLPCWKQSVLLALGRGDLATQRSCILVFVDQCGLGEALVKRLEQQGQDVIIVKIGSEFAQLSDRIYTLAPQERHHYDALFDELLAQDKLPNRIVHLWTVTPPGHIESGFEAVDKAQEKGFYSLLFLAQALSKQHITDTLQIAVISNNLQSVTGEEVICPEKATVLGPVQVISQEYPNISCHSIDVVLPASGSRQAEKLVHQLLAELTALTSDRIIAYRGFHRWVQTFEPVRLDKAVEETPRLKLREGGVYLITGGLGGIGLVLAEYLAKTVRAKLILTGRSALPAKDEWEQWLATHDEQDSISHKIRKVQELEALGAEVLVVSADVANLEQMQAAIDRAQRQFGSLNGVIHGAGITEDRLFTVIQQTSKADCEQHFQPKVRGLLVLEKVLQGTDIDFCLLLSSLSSVLGGLGYVAYAAANLFMDAFGRQQQQNSDIPWISVNWDGWQFEENTKKTASVASNLAEFAIKPDEGLKAFRRILFWGELNQVVVSTGDLQARIDQWIKLESLSVNSGSLHSRLDLQNAYVAPSNETERAIAEIWQEILGVEKVGIHDDFFELGGHSLMATQLMSRVRTSFGVELKFQNFLTSPTIKSLSETVEEALVSKSSSATSDLKSLREEAVRTQESNFIPRRLHQDTAPLSFAQQRLWLLDQLQPGSFAYTEATAMCLVGSLNVTALEQALNEIVRRHEVLRTSLTVVDGQPVQVIAPSLTVKLPVMNLCELAEAERSLKVEQLLTEWRQQRFDLARVPLLQWMLLQLGEQEHLLLLSMHHIVTDGWSAGVFFRELTTLYNAFSQGQPSPLPELSIQYADFAVWQRQWLQGEVLATQLTYWKRQLGTIPPVLKLSSDRSSTSSSAGKKHSFALSSTLTEALKALSQREGVTLFMTLLAAFKTLLYRYSGQEDIAVGSPIANRNRRETEELIGFFVNTLVLRTDLSGNPSFQDVLRQVREVALGAYAHQDLPFEKLVAELQPERNLGHNPLFQVWFVLQNTPMPTVELPSLKLNLLEVETGVARYDLKLDLTETPEGLTGFFEYKTDLFEASAIACMTQLYETLLKTVIEQADIQLNALVAVLENAEKQQQLAQEEEFKTARRQKLGNIRRKPVKS